MPLVDRIVEYHDEMTALRRDIHRHPELAYDEHRTARIVAERLEALGVEVTQGLGRTGVVGTIRSGRGNRAIALRADMDGLPVPERNDLPYRSKAVGEYRGEEVPVMHACGHDTHVAILMGVAEALAGMREEIPGTVKFIFQPAEEGAPEGEEGGAELMQKEGVLSNPDVDAAFALHILAEEEVGTLIYRPGPYMAAVQDYRILVNGRQTHGAAPWDGVDAIVTASQIVMGLQAIVSRTLNITENPATVTVGAFNGGVRSNIIPEQVELLGTIRTFDPEQTALVHRRIREIAEHVAAAAGAEVEVTIPYTNSYPVTYNDPELTAFGVESLKRAAGADNVNEVTLETGAEDFSFFAQEVPGFYFGLGGRPRDVSREEAASHHTPDFFVDEGALVLGVESMLAVTLDYLQANAPVMEDQERP